jgi:hypothetical protein
MAGGADRTAVVHEQASESALTSGVTHTISGRLWDKRNATEVVNSALEMPLFPGCHRPRRAFRRMTFGGYH